MIGYDDKRNFYRMMMNSPCELSVIDDPSHRRMQAICKDLSATGMSLEIDEPNVALGTLLDIFIESQNDQFPSLNAKAKVIRCEQEADSACLVGVEISEMQ